MNKRLAISQFDIFPEISLCDDGNYIGGLGERVRQQSPNREIGFVSSSFSFRVVRASGRGEAAWAREGRHPERWASREPGWVRSVPG